MNLPLGYAYASTYAGIRKDEKDDLALIVTGMPANAAGVFTQNRAAAAPVKLCRRHLALSKGKVGAVLVNAGNANCATRTGDAVALATVKAAARWLRLPPAQVLPASTGVIGVELEAQKILSALPRLLEKLAIDGFDEVARAIMTTDLVPKTAFAQVKLRRGTVRFAGMTKGSGMIHPQMATTLGFVLTDAVLPTAILRRILKRCVESSYNRLSVDGDTSTNDTLLLLANGASGVGADPKEVAKVEEAAASVMQDLAKAIARDGEGAKKFVTIDVTGASSDEAAAKLARAIANSPLVKTAIAGSDANWGRILSAAGNARVAFDPAKVDIRMQGVVVCRQGLAAPFSEADLKRKLDEPDCEIRFHLSGKGKGSARFWTCDLTEGYIRINASYRT
ncbi:MAG TPA: bifunctional glutamate N-acetyltransferase/amino-acid acetyltransferase ArgJ [Verrucomicrobiae bacterium]|nr:bifunctional glutamate N-acetyltransferase/amino-acid acetyltransferase ArgJ [Verrucomicrobiae bacterium]